MNKNQNKKKYIDEIHPILKNIIKERGIDDLNSFFYPDFSYICNDEMKNMCIAKAIVGSAILDKSNVSIYFDCDVDGITAGTIMYKYLKDFEIKSNIIINKGKDHAFHPESVPGDTDLLIIVDSISNDYNLYYDLANKGMAIIILDHHTILKYPEHKNVLLVTSNRDYHNPHLSGAGVVYKFCLSIDELFETTYANEYIDLAACGIIADVSDMSISSMENRTICKHGMDNPKNTFIKYLLKDKRFDSKFISWTLSPLINSLNRANQNQLAIDLFLCDDENELEKLIEDSKYYKMLQNEIIQDILNMAQDKIFGLEHQNKNYKFLYVNIPYEHLNYSGVLANKIQDVYNKPTIVVAYNEDDDTLYGSIRANGINFAEEINSCLVDSNDYCKGHAEAAGIKIHFTNWNMFLNNLKEKDFKQLEVKKYDYELSFNDISKKLAENVMFLNRVTGKNFPLIKFKLSNIMIDRIFVLINKHTKFLYNEVVFLKWNDTSLFDKYIESNNIVLEVIGELEINSFAGQTNLQFVISEITKIETLNFRI